MAASKKKIPITELPIYVYKPMQEGRPYLAYIEGLNLRFSAQTAMGAMKLAREWAKENCQFKEDKSGDEE